MTALSQHHVFHWFTSPDELIRLAQEMRERWEEISPGEDKTIEVYCGRDCELRVLIDQERMAEVYGRAWQKRTVPKLKYFPVAK